MNEIDETLDALREVQEKIAEWRRAEVFDGDRGFQDLLERESSLKERLEILQQS